MKNITDKILLAHGSGGRLTHELIEQLFRSGFSNKVLDSLDDAAEIKLPGGARLAFTTDSFVVDPLFFPGGDIGKLAVCGTVNDLAMKGAKPVAISVAAIIEEGFEIDKLKIITGSIQKAAKEAGVFVATGDTKVVPRGKADKLFLTTSGVGIIDKKAGGISGSNAKPGQTVIISGTLGDHGLAVLLSRNEFRLRAKIRSDCAPLNGLVADMASKCRGISVLRDPTRGGLATTLNEIAQSSGVGIIIEENQIPVGREVRSACSILGFDPLYIANEGKLAAFCPAGEATGLVQTMRKQKYGKNAAVIGKVVRSPKGVWLNTVSGGLRPLAMLEGEQLPRIC